MKKIKLLLIFHYQKGEFEEEKIIIFRILLLRNMQVVGYYSSNSLYKVENCLNNRLYKCIPFTHKRYEKVHVLYEFNAKLSNRLQDVHCTLFT